MYRLLRPLFFRLEPEYAHALTLHALRIAGKFAPLRWLISQQFKTPPKPVEEFGLTFKNPVGLAAGYDKDGIAICGLAALGFSHVEIGTVTPKPQAGNPSPRVFRLLEDEAVINRLGFPSRGSIYLQQNLKKIKKLNVILGINLGKNKDTPNEEAIFDYLALLQNFAPYADYLTINISSPNTVGLRNLQGRKALEGLLAQLHQQRLIEQAQYKKQLPMLVKLSPDLTEAELADATEAIINTKMDGIIVTNTTLAREGLRSSLKRESGGLSGKPLKGRSEAVLHQALKLVNGAIPIVSVGGIMNPEDVKRRLEVGAALVQIYTGLVYRGAGLVKEIVKAL